MAGHVKRSGGEMPKGAFSEWERLVDTGVGKAAWKAVVGGELPRVRYEVVSDQRERGRSKPSSKVIVVDLAKAGRTAKLVVKKAVMHDTARMVSRSSDAGQMSPLAVEAAKAAAERAQKEKQVRILYYYQLADRAFGDHRLARKFMTRKHPKFGVSPLEKLATEWGGREVEQVLNSMIYGLPA